MDVKYIKGKTTPKDDGTIQMVVFSDSTKDRAGDTIDPEGWKLDNFKRNPVLLWAHDTGLDKSLPAIGNVENLKIDPKGRLVGSLKFDKDDDFAMKVYNKYKKGIIRATSVGFMPLEMEENENKGINFKEQELLEVSCVNVPANHNALTQLREMKSKSAKTQAKLMKEYLEKHEPKKTKSKKEDKQDEEDPMAERLNGVVTELENATNALRQVVNQLETRSQEITEKKDYSHKALKDLIDAYRLADKAGELFLKKSKALRRGGENK